MRYRFDNFGKAIVFTHLFESYNSEGIECE
jgi:hypothetical protein